MAASLLSRRGLLFAVLGVAALYGWWVASQYQRLTELNQRELADTANELKTTIETAFGNIRLYDTQGTSKAPACDFDLDQPYLELLNKCEDQHTKWTNPRLELMGGVFVLADRLGVPPAQSSSPLRFRFRTDLSLGELPFTERFQRVFVVDTNGTVVHVPRSVAFDKMEHAEFTAYFDKVKALIVEHLIPGLNSAALEREARAMLGEAA